MNNPPTDFVPATPARSQATWALIARNSLLAAGFAVLILGAVADIAHYLDGHSSSESASATATALVQTQADPPESALGALEREAAEDAATTVSVLPTPSPEGGLFDPVFNSHTVAPGDVLYTIAQHYGTTTQVLIELNALEDPNRIEVGQVIALPEPAPES